MATLALDAWANVKAVTFRHLTLSRAKAQQQFSHAARYDEKNG